MYIYLDCINHACALVHTALADGVRAHTNVFFNIIYIRELKRAPLGLLYNIHINTLFPCCRCKRSGVFE